MAYSMWFHFCGQPNIDTFFQVEKLLEHNKPNYVEYLLLKYDIIVDIFIVSYIFQILFFTIGMNICCLHNTS